MSSRGRRSRSARASEPAEPSQGEGAVKKAELLGVTSPGDKSGRQHSRWGGDDAKAFFFAFREHGADWDKVSKAIGRSADDCKELFSHHAGYLNISPEFLSDVVFCKIVSDQQRALFGDEQSQPNEGAEAGLKPEQGGEEAPQRAAAAAAGDAAAGPSDAQPQGSGDTVSEGGGGGGGGGGSRGANGAASTASGSSRGKQADADKGGAAGPAVADGPSRSAGRRTIKPTPKMMPTQETPPRSGSKAQPRTPASIKSEQRRAPRVSEHAAAGGGRASPLESPMGKRKRVKKLHFDEQETARPTGWRRLGGARTEDEAHGADALLSLAAVCSTEGSEPPDPAFLAFGGGAGPAHEPLSSPVPRGPRGGVPRAPRSASRSAAGGGPAAGPAGEGPGFVIHESGYFYNAVELARAAHAGPVRPPPAGYHLLQPVSAAPGTASALVLGPGLVSGGAGSLDEPGGGYEPATSGATAGSGLRGGDGGASSRGPRRRKPAPERLPPMQTPIKTLFMRRTAFAPVPGGHGLALGHTGGGLDAAAAGLLLDSAPEARLRHCLSARVRRWAMHEFLYSALDRPWFMQNELKDFLAHLGLGSVTHLTRGEWALVRGALGKPRRLSLRFLKEERAKLQQWRDAVRQAYDDIGRGVLEVLPPQLPRQLHVGQRVTARHPQTRQIHDGQVLTVEPSAYRVQFDRRELGVELVRDVDVMPVNPLESLPQVMLASAAPSLLLNGQHPGRARPRGSGGGHGLVAPGALSREALVHSIADVNSGLEKKEALLVQLRAMNDEVEAGAVDPSQPGIAAEPFKHGYAGVVLTLKQVNQELEGGLIRLDQCIAGAPGPDGAVQLLLPQAGGAGEPVTPACGGATGGGAVPLASGAWVEAEAIVSRCRAQLAAKHGGEGGGAGEGGAGDGAAGAAPGGQAAEPSGGDAAAAGGSGAGADGAAGASPSEGGAGAAGSGGGEGSGCGGDGDGGGEAAWLRHLITGCVSSLLILQRCADSALPPDTVREALDSALMFVRPHAGGNEPLYAQIRASINALKAQLTA